MQESSENQGPQAPLPVRTGRRGHVHEAGPTEESSDPLKRPDPRGCRHVLVVEDNPADVRLLQQAFRSADLAIGVELEFAAAGDEALDLLHDPNHHRPDLVLLDLNLPRRNGREVLAEVKADPKLRTIPVVILSGSTSEDDVRAAIDLHANAYVVKPLHLAAFRELARSITAFWLCSARLPTC